MEAIGDAVYHRTNEWGGEVYSITRAELLAGMGRNGWRGSYDASRDEWFVWSSVYGAATGHVLSRVPAKVSPTVFRRVRDLVVGDVVTFDEGAHWYTVVEVRTHSPAGEPYGDFRGLGWVEWGSGRRSDTGLRGSGWVRVSRQSVLSVPVEH